jgi:uncharacterized paraquat-inducible protein A
MDATPEIDQKKLAELDRHLFGRRTQWKCPKCQECFRWPGRFPLRKAFCPGCGTKLKATTHQKKWPWFDLLRPLTAVEAWDKFNRYL